MGRKIVIVGGGVIGLCTAYFVRGTTDLDVTVVERAEVGAGASWGNAGWLVPSMSAPLPASGVLGTAIRSLADANGALRLDPSAVPGMLPWLWRFLRASTPGRHEAGLHATAALAAHTMDDYDRLAADGVEFPMVDTGLLYVGLAGEKVEAVRRSLAPFADYYGYAIPDHVTSGAALREAEPALLPGVEAGLLISGERTVHPPGLLAALRARVADMGVTVLERHAVTGFAASGRRVRAVRVGGGELAADHVVLAAGIWTGPLARLLGVDVPLQAGKGYSLSVTPTTSPRRSLYLGEAKIGASPFGSRLRLAGGMDLGRIDERVDAGRLAAIERNAARFLVPWEAGSETDRWAGMRPMAPDGLPVIGPAPGWDNLTVATGHAMLGVTLGPTTGRLVARIVRDGAVDPLLAPFRLARFGSRGRTPV